jgi:hypothetical protein
MGLFEGVETAKGMGNNPKLSAGIHDVEVQNCQAKKGFFGNVYIVEYKVLKSGNTADPVGVTRGWTQNLDAKNETEKDGKLGALKAFASACLGVDPKDADKVEKEVSPIVKKALEQSISQDQVFKGVKVRVQVEAARKTKSNFDFVPHSFSPVT